MNLVTASALPAALETAIDLDLLRLINNAASVSAAQLATQIANSNPDSPAVLDRILSLLAANNVLNCKLSTAEDGGVGVERLYSLSPYSKFLISNKDGNSLVPLFLTVRDNVFMQSWKHLKDAVVEGEVPFEKAHGSSAFECIAMYPRLNQLFNRGMSELSGISMGGILDKYNGFEGLNTLVDVGGGVGTCLKTIISKYTSIKGINFDLPHVIQDAPPIPGVEHVSGDMFTNVPSGDAIFMKFITHDWGDAHCLTLFKNCYEALPHRGKLIIADFLLPEIPENTSLAAQDFAFDITMLAYTRGGKERTETEFRALGKASGFNEFRKVCSCFNIWIMELHK